MFSTDKASYYGTRGRVFRVGRLTPRREGCRCGIRWRNHWFKNLVDWRWRRQVRVRLRYARCGNCERLRGLVLLVDWFRAPCFTVS